MTDADAHLARLVHRDLGQHIPGLHLFPNAVSIVTPVCQKDAGLTAWYRNPDRASQDSLAAFYEAGGANKLVRPDFIFFSGGDDGEIAADIVDPHGIHLSDALPKLRGLADYAEESGGHFRRIETIAEIDGKLRVLDLTEQHVRDAVRAAQDAKVLYAGVAGADYVSIFTYCANG